MKTTQLSFILKAQTLFMSTLLILTSCSTEELSYEETEIAIEENSLTKLETTNKIFCSSCTESPATYPRFSTALLDSKLQSEFLLGDQKDLKNFCNTEFFTICDNNLVMTGPDILSDRTELRQVKDLSLNDFSQMKFSATYENLPTSSITKGVTIAQIHNDYVRVSRPLLRLDIVNGNRLQSHINHSFIKNDGPASNDNLISIKEGERLYVRMDISSFGNRVYVYAENKTTGEAASKMYIVNSNWNEANGQYYFKTGIYTQVDGYSSKASYDYLYFNY